MKNYITLLTYLFFSVSSLALSAEAMVPPTFDIEVSLDHCPEHRIRPSLQLEVFYTLGTSQNLIPANVISLTENNTENTATAILRFPTNLGTTSFNIQARCFDTNEASSLSNKVSLSNCNFISTIDSDNDGITNNFEDTDCNNTFSNQDFSNYENIDTDGDGIRDFAEVFTATNPKNPGSSFVPLVFSSAPFDPNNDGTSNAVAWRSSVGKFYIKDFYSPGSHYSTKIGRNGDIPITYQPEQAPHNIGVIRIEANGLLNWYLRGAGFKNNNGIRETAFSLGAQSDHIVFGPYERPGITNPAVAKLVNSQWVFIIKQANGSIRTQNWGLSEDIPKPQDYDGDGIFDIAVFRPSTLETYIINSSTNSVSVYEFGSITSELMVKGDYTGDGKADITFWEPLTAVYYTLKSDNGFDPAQAALMNPLYYDQVQLGLYFIHYPLNFNRRGNRIVYTVADRSNGLRHYWINNQPAQGIVSEQWGISGDHLG